MEWVAWITGGVALVGALIAVLRALVGHAETRAISPQPLMVKQAEEYARIRDLEALRVEFKSSLEGYERRMDKDMSLIRADLAAVRKSGEYVERRVNGMTRTLYAIAGKMGIVTGGTEDIT